MVVPKLETRRVGTAAASAKLENRRLSTTGVGSAAATTAVRGGWRGDDSVSPPKRCERRSEAEAFRSASSDSIHRWFELASSASSASSLTGAAPAGSASTAISAISDSAATAISAISDSAATAGSSTASASRATSGRFVDWFIDWFVNWFVDWFVHGVRVSMCADSCTDSSYCGVCIALLAALGRTPWTVPKEEGRRAPTVAGCIGVGCIGVGAAPTPGRTVPKEEGRRAPTVAGCIGVGCIGVGAARGEGAGGVATADAVAPI